MNYTLLFSCFGRYVLDLCKSGQSYTVGLFDKSTHTSTVQRASARTEADTLFESLRAAYNLPAPETVRHDYFANID